MKHIFIIVKYLYKLIIMMKLDIYIFSFYAFLVYNNENNYV